MNKIITVGSFSLAILYLLANTSCDKPTDCKGQVTVVDSLNQCIEGASVYVYAGQIAETDTTNINGIANFDLKLPAILSISATAVISDTRGKKDTVHGSGAIQFQAGETGYTTVMAKQ